jgi:vacuolar-type H+-ATPase subunit F/Vma7
MKAETAYQVISVLPESEVARLYQMLGVQSANIVKLTKSKKKQLISDAEATEYILRKLRIA